MVWLVSPRGAPRGLSGGGSGVQGWGFPCAEWPAVWQGLSAPGGENQPGDLRLLSEVVSGSGAVPRPPEADSALGRIGLSVVSSYSMS